MGKTTCAYAHSRWLAIRLCGNMSFHPSTWAGVVYDLVMASRDASRRVCCAVRLRPGDSRQNGQPSPPSFVNASLAKPELLAEALI